MHSQIQLHLTFHKIHPIADEALHDTWMSAHKCPHMLAGYLNTEMRLFTFLIGSLNNSGEECCKRSASLTAKDVFKQRKKCPQKTLESCTPNDLML